MESNRTLRYLTFALLYFTQGTILGYFASLNALYLLDRGLNMTSVGIFGAIALIPFVIKIFLGMLSDRVNLLGMGHRKPYILIGLAVQTLTLLAVPAVDPGKKFWLFVGLAFLLQLGMALYDTCTDGLALDTTPEAEQGRIQGFMVGGRAIGTIVAASMVGLLAQKVGWSSVFYTLAALTLLPLPLVLRVREPQREAAQRFEWQAFSAFKHWPVVASGLFGLVVFLVIVGGNQLINPFLTQELGINLAQAGMVTSLWGVGIVLGSILGAVLLKRGKDLRGTLAMMALVSLSLALLAVLVRPAVPLAAAIGLVVFFGLAYGSAQTVVFALCMRFVDARIAASMFAILMAFTNVGQGIGMALGGKLADGMGFGTTLLVFAAIMALGLPFLPALFRRREGDAGVDA